MPESSGDWSLYLIRCGDGSLYAGITTDVARRLHEHEHARKGAKYLRGRKPLSLVFSARVGDRSLASRLEYRVKRLDRAAKERLVAGTTQVTTLIDDLVLDQKAV